MTLKATAIDDSQADLPHLSAIQWQFVAARLQTRTDKEAAESIGIDDKTPPRWANKPEINDLIAGLRRDAAVGVVAFLNQAALTAAVKVYDSMNSGDASVSLRAAQDVLDRTLGKAMQRSELSGLLSVRDEMEEISDDELQRRIGIIARGALAGISAVDDTMDGTAEPFADAESEGQS